MLCFLLDTVQSSCVDLLHVAPGPSAVAVSVPDLDSSLAKRLLSPSGHFSGRVPSSLSIYEIPGLQLARPSWPGARWWAADKKARNGFAVRISAARFSSGWLARPNSSALRLLTSLPIRDEYFHKPGFEMGFCERTSTSQCRNSNYFSLQSYWASLSTAVIWGKIIHHRVKLTENLRWGFSR